MAKVRTALGNNSIAITFDGDHDENADVSLQAFYQGLQRIHRVLVKIESKQFGEHSTKYTIADLSHSSPARVVIEANGIPKKPDYSVAVMRGFDAALHAVYTGKAIEQVDDEILEDLREIALPVGKQIRSLVISTPKDAYEITEKIAKRIDLELTADETEYGTYEGMLEQINIHDSQNYFHIYSDCGLKKLKCKFSASLVDVATAAIGRRVLVTGLLKYRANSNFPFEIIAQDIEIFPLDIELPDFEDLRGRAPNLTNGLSSEDYIAELRDGWQ